ncbi:MAG: helix-turn-helix domain-containing protein [Candidatus Coprovivens sp.]
MNKMTQKDRILRHLRDYGHITSWESFVEYGITRLSAIIYNLKHLDGFEFDEEWQTRTNRYGEKTSFKKYILKERDM